MCANLVGEMMIAPTWCLLIGSDNRNSFSTIGIRNASVFPLPVTAWHMSVKILDCCFCASCLHDNIFVAQEKWYAIRLDRGHFGKAHAGDGVQDPF